MIREELAAAMLPLTSDGGPPDSHPVLDATGTSWTSAAEALRIGVLGLCGCGFEGITRDLVALLDDVEAADLLDGDAYREVLLHLLDDAGLLEHGGNVRYSWRTPLGDSWLATIRELTP